VSGPIVIGRSVEGRPLEVYQFGHGAVHRLIVAGIHGGYEWNTIALAQELKAHLADHPELVPPHITLYLLMALNPDGEARSHSYEGRANAHNVDLNRNWPAHWKEDWSRAGCWNNLPIEAGPQPVSEPEVAALMGFILEQRISALISYHSAALGIFAGGQPSSRASLSLAEAVAEVSPYPYPPLENGCEYTGQFADWAAENGIPAIDVELTNHTDTDFEINLRVLETFLNWKP
jgi:predicted deacylase